MAIIARHLLAVNNLFHQGVLAQQRFHLFEVILHVFGVVAFPVGVVHGSFLQMARYCKEFDTGLRGKFAGFKAAAIEVIPFLN